MLVAGPVRCLSCGQRNLRRNPEEGGERWGTIGQFLSDDDDDNDGDGDDEMKILTMTMTIMVKDKESLRRKMRHDDFDDGHNNCDPTKNLCLSGRLNKGDEKGQLGFHFLPPLL